MNQRRITVLGFAVLPLIFFLDCFPGGIVTKGGSVHSAGFFASATRTQGAPYLIVCYDEKEAKRREELREKDEKAEIPAGPPVRFADPATYKGGCELEGESSVFFLFNLWPATPRLNPEYALAAAVQKVEGDSMVNVRFWHETHYYSLLGLVHVFKVRGDVIKFLGGEDPRKKDKDKAKGGGR